MLHWLVVGAGYLISSRFALASLWLFMSGDCGFGSSLVPLAGFRFSEPCSSRADPSPRFSYFWLFFSTDGFFFPPFLARAMTANTHLVSSSSSDGGSLALVILFRLVSLWPLFGYSCLAIVVLALSRLWLALAFRSRPPLLPRPLCRFTPLFLLLPALLWQRRLLLPVIPRRSHNSQHPLGILILQ